MTESDIGQVFEAGRLPSFAAFAVRHGTGEPHNRFADEEAALLHPRAVPDRRNAFHLGREAAHAALAKLGRDDGPILHGNSRDPIWPVGIRGAISHSAHVGVALVAHAAYTDGVGVDIETRRSAPELHDQVPRDEERRWLATMPLAARDDAVMALFSAKETIFKAFFPRVGRFFGFEAASLEPTPHGFRARILADLDPAYPPERTLQVQCRWHGEMVVTWLILPGPKATPNWKQG